MLSRAAFVAAAIVLAAIGSAIPAYSSPGGSCYTAVSGDCVSYPQQGGPQPSNATAQCADGSWSFSEHPHSSGTCHGHGGVQRYL
ncbi:DUF3761 domain-containing protein [Mycobacterium sp. 852002-50816_SCH5313054-b]|uniref:DUF3761 domain-containing protein n=1 Tax=Mycobacterium sp. 852002-50816_SCH5313054-b TaxID=1834092 RepID=UPI0009EF0784|nr:DUF3761 domain-containing protein [Mycobacterium sp. 852002-50816_SCH5313054-b]